MLLFLTCLRADSSPKYFKGFKSFTFEIAREKRFLLKTGFYSVLWAHGV